MPKVWFGIFGAFGSSDYRSPTPNLFSNRRLA